MQMEFSVEIYEWTGTSWIPYVANDVQVQFDNHLWLPKYSTTTNGCRVSRQPKLVAEQLGNQDWLLRNLATSLVPNSEFLNLRVPCIEFLFHKSDFSTWKCGKSNFYPNPRFFSSNSSEDYEKELAESSVLKANEGSNEVSGSADNVFDESMSSISSEFEAGSSIFNDGLAAEIDDNSVHLDEKFDSFATEDENIEKMEEND
ncbi:hypothetical protein Fot_34406 [Forsythia ovata]|uniref:Uncharacterized protein n=1 Tax=Forsythia ovata TaxID=205694 RepID=A0ABD1SLG8_9LAMI